jgi:multidrug efflux system outer membrane protein
MRKTTVLLLAVVLLSGCAARQRTSTMRVVLPERIEGGGTTTDAPVERDWWRQFGDAALDGLIEEALVANRDLHGASARYRAAVEVAGAARAILLPSGSAAAGASRQHASAHEAPGASERTTSTLSAGLQVGWEADVFGRLRGRARAAAADAHVAAADVRGVQVAVAAHVAAAYFELRGAQQERDLLAELQARTRELLQLTQTRVTAGRVTRIDLLRAEQLAADLAFESSAAAHREAAARHRIATLLGRDASQLAIPDTPPTQLTATVLSIGGVADLLRRRPDIQAARHRLDAAAARAGAARADLFPRVEVTGGISLIAGSLNRLTDAAAGSWFIAPRIIWHALDWPRLRREARAADHLTDAAFAEYEHAVLRGLEETRTAVDAYGASASQLQAADQRALAADEAARIVTLQYREGMVDSLARVLAERDAISASLAAARALTAQRRTVVDVYRVLGGGWR